MFWLGFQVAFGYTFEMKNQSKKVEVDYIIIGAGIAGLSAAYHLAKQAKVALISKGPIKESSTAYAQGGIAVALKKDDAPQLHYQDTLAAGAGLCNASRVKILVEEGPARVAELIEMGANFDMFQGELSFTKEAAHQKRRILHAKDATGAEIEKTLGRKLLGNANIRFFARTTVNQLLTKDKACKGCVAYNSNGESIEFWAKATLMATGGASQLFSRNSNPIYATGDGLALAYQAGATLQDLEFVQFHPTTLFEGDKKPISLFLISEALRGEGGLLRNSLGERFMPNYHSQAELAPRDIVARAIFSEMQTTGSKNVFLDVTHLNQRIESRFSTIYKRCLAANIDAKHHWIPVAPAAHYMIGGIRVDENGATDMDGLLACGEVAATGIHGANRLASNSLLEGLVFGYRAAQYMLHSSFKQVSPGLRIRNQFTHLSSQQCSQLAYIRQELKSCMWDYVGIVRDYKGLKRAEKIISLLNSQLASLPQQRLSLELDHMLLIAGLMVSAALQRNESRGAHFRRDFNQTQAALQKHVLFNKFSKVASDSFEI